jgi:hypothetical protein
LFKVQLFILWILAFTLPEQEPLGIQANPTNHRPFRTNPSGHKKTGKKETLFNFADFLKIFLSTA